MDDHALDPTDEQFDPDARIIVLRFFSLESEARLYAARLREAGVRHFLSNANMSTTLPLTQSGIGLHVREQDLQQATAILARLDYQKQHAEIEENYHDADLADIEYHKALHAPSKPTVNWLLIVLGLLATLVLLRALLRALGIVESWRDAF
jgi:hypothetical protein